MFHRALLRLSDQRSMRVTGVGFSISFHRTSNRSPQWGNFSYKSAMFSGFRAPRGPSCLCEKIAKPSEKTASLFAASWRTSEAPSMAGKSRL